MKQFNNDNFPKSGFLLFDNILLAILYLFELIEKDVKAFIIIILVIFSGFLLYMNLKQNERHTIEKTSIENKNEELYSDCDSMLKSRNVLIDSLQRLLLKNEIEFHSDMIKSMQDNEKLAIELERYLKK